jgi:hypothetical protein
MEVLTPATSLTPLALGACVPPVVLEEGHAITTELVEKAVG